ncbi:hypothetical protein Ancab_038209 [Ancistrocladus abbreviatus]
MAGDPSTLSNDHVLSFSKKREEEADSISYLSDEIIHNILRRIPAHILLKTMRYVCRKWHTIISDPEFVRAHFLRSTPGLLLQGFSFVEVDSKGNVELTRLGDPLPFPSRVIGSCDGLVLCLGFQNGRRIYYILNPVTKEHMTLPPAPSHDSDGLFLAYVPSLKKYKVLIMYFVGKQPPYFAIRTMGIDRAWRAMILCPSFRSNIALRLSYTYPSCIDGFAYFPDKNTCRLLILDLETEDFHGTYTPIEQGGASCSRYFLKMGSFLSLLLESANFKWQVWFLKDPKAGVWEKCFDVDVGANLDKLDVHVECCFIVPVLWLENGGDLLFRLKWKHKRPEMGQIHFIYHVSTGHVSRCGGDFNSSGICRIHVNSLATPHKFWPRS